MFTVQLQETGFYYLMGEGAAGYPRIKDLVDETTFLKEKRDLIQMQREKDHATAGRIEIVVTTLNQAPAELQWDESVIRQLVDTVKVVSKNKIIVYLRSGVQIEQEISE